MLRTQTNAKWHVASSVLVILTGWWCQLDRWEWGLLILALALVWIAEGFNTALEQLADAVSKEEHPLIGLAKDLAAAAVLIAALFASAIAGLIFLPRWW